MKDKNGIKIEIGYSVEVPAPSSGDMWSNDFVGTVEDFHGDYVTVIDGDGDCFDVEPERLQLFEEE